MLRARIGGQCRDIELGPLKILSLAEALARAYEMRHKIAQGIDPIPECRRAADPVFAFRDAARQVHQKQKAAWKNGKHQDQLIRPLEAHASPILDSRLVIEIEGPMIREAILPIWLSKPDTARRVRQRIGSVLDWSYARVYRSAEAPMRTLSKDLPRQPRKDGHFAAMPYADIPAFIERLRERVSVGRLAPEAFILTTSRSGEIGGASWDGVDLQTGIWSVPAERMKLAPPHHVPLAP